MDETASLLDSVTTQHIEDLMTSLKEIVTVVIVTHNMHQAARVSDDCAFLLMGEDRTGELIELIELIEFATTAKTSRIRPPSGCSTTSRATSADQVEPSAATTAVASSIPVSSTVHRSVASTTSGRSGGS